MTQIATTIEQSKRLLDAGLDPKSADMYWGHVDFGGSMQIVVLPANPHLDINSTISPAWSLSKLWDICNECGIGPFNFGGDDLDSSSLMDKLIKWIILGIFDHEVLDEYLTAETIQELNRHANH